MYSRGNICIPEDVMWQLIYTKYDYVRDMDSCSINSTLKLIKEKNSNKFFVAKSISASTNIIRQNAIRESKIHYSLKHKNIIDFEGIYECKTHIVLIIKYANGGDLLNALNRYGIVSEPLAKYLFKQLIEALYFIHSNLVCHHDIKLENILLSVTSEIQIKLTDFGLSTCKVQPFCHQNHGTQLYAAPELFDKNPEGHEDELIDVYSAGIVLYSLLNRKLPFSSILRKQLYYLDPKNKLQFSFSINPKVKELIETMLVKDPKRRPTLKEILVNEWLNTPDEVNIIIEYNRWVENDDDLFGY